MSVQRFLVSTATLALGSFALVACDPGSATGSAPTGTAATASAPAHATASPTVDASLASTGTAAKGNGSAKATPTAARQTGTHSSGTASGGGTRAGMCRAGQLTVTAAPVSQPLNHLLITAKNTSGARCDLGIIGLVTFDGRVRATTPGGIGGGPNILRPGQSNYEGVALDQQDAPGQGSDTSYLTVKLDSGDTLRIPVKAHVHAPRISVWEPSAADALSAA
ncbi:MULTISPECIES: DUF4232 domain-containing protein [unclassified Streptomyces]|uniref:DUF4232 domain-containing protein n=1 Tax=unclassified Streptomyces TaxID=2593676 RepID=UPI0011A5ECB9|nr:DUF4232 domain-containing protein [Streptomyces sp. BK340]TVZ81432.1 uncharacterized protein DUF4232 [Streptomyces sp. BK340]